MCMLLSSGVRSGALVALAIFVYGIQLRGKTEKLLVEGFGRIVLRRLSGAHRHAQCDRPPVGKRRDGRRGGGF